MFQVALTIAFLLCPQFEPLQMFPKGVAHQCRAILFCQARGPIGSLQQFLIKDDLDRLHMWTPFHTILHTRFSLLSQQPEDAGVRFEGEVGDGLQLAEVLAGPRVFYAVGGGVDVECLEAGVDDHLRLARVEQRQRN